MSWSLLRVPRAAVLRHPRGTRHCDQRGVAGAGRRDVLLGLRHHGGQLLPLGPGEPLLCLGPDDALHCMHTKGAIVVYVVWASEGVRGVRGM